MHLTVNPRGAPVGEKVEAESYVAQHGWTDGGANFVENNPAASGGKNVGWTAAGNWLQYRVDVAEAGTYDLEFRVANGTGAVAAGCRVRSGRGRAPCWPRCRCRTPAGGRRTSPFTTQVTLPAGDQVVTVFCETGGFNLDYLRLTS